MYAKATLHSEKSQVLGPEGDEEYSVRKKQSPTACVKKANVIPEYTAIFCPKILVT